MTPATTSLPALSLERSPEPAERDAVALRLAEIAAAAGVILRAYERGGCQHHLKADGSPTSQADLAAEAQIVAALGEAWPGIPVIAEETAAEAARPPCSSWSIPSTAPRIF